MAIPSQTDWRGVFPAVLTQFRDDFGLDLPAVNRHVTALLDSGVHAVIMLGTLGESSSLEYGEKLELMRATVAHVAGRVPVLSGVAECSTALACRFAADCERAGVDGLMVLPAMIYKSDARETLAHFRAVAAASSLPIICY